jgi:hypothetical protein
MPRLFSFRQSRFSQALFQAIEMFGPPDGDQALEIGKAHRGVDLTQTRHGFLRLGKLPGERSARVWLLSGAP